MPVKEAKLCLIDDVARHTVAISGLQSFRYMTCLWDLITPSGKKIRFVNNVVKPASQVIYALSNRDKS
jgi:hypothetical protein